MKSVSILRKISVNFQNVISETKMYNEEEINFLSVAPLKNVQNIMSLLYVSEHSKHFLKPVKKLGLGWRPTHPIGTNSQIWPFF